LSRTLLAIADPTRREVRGREHRLSLEARPLREAADWISVYRPFWEQRLDAFLRRDRRPRRQGRRARL